MADVAHYPNEDCDCESEADERCEYRMLADTVIANLDARDGDEAEVALLTRAIEDAAATIAKLKALGWDMLGTFTKTSDGHRARVGQVQIARWEKQLGGSDG
jgi:hypothetical protein